MESLKQSRSCSFCSNLLRFPSMSFKSRKCNRVERQSCRQLDRTSCFLHTKSHRNELILNRQYHTPFLLGLWCLMLVCSLLPYTLAQKEVVIPSTTAPNSTTTAFSPTVPSFNPFICASSLETPAQISFICGQNPTIFPILQYAEKYAKAKCEEQFKDSIWNCSGFSLLRRPNITKRDHIFKESNYVYSLSLAVITHTVARGCLDGLIKNCICSGSQTSSDGCSNYTEYGLDIAEQFLSKRQAVIGGGLQSYVATHNLLAAKMLIRQTLNTSKEVCRCHGISGTCTFSSCISELPDFSVLSKALKEAYDQSCKIVVHGRSRNEWVSKCGRSITKTNLVYTDEYDWCRYDPSVGSVGVVGRECHPLPGRPNSCSNFCGRCGKGHTQHNVESQVQCESGCHFRFCCHIVCDMCIRRQTYYTCSDS